MRIISGKARGTKLYTLEGTNTRPTLDRVKESLFSIIQADIQDAIILDLFAGSGAIGLEFLSRGAKKAILCDNSKQAIEVIKKNVQKTHFEATTEVKNMDFATCLKNLNNQNIDLIYIDPPYETKYIYIALQLIIELNIIKQHGKIILETDDEERVLEEIKNIDVEIVDKRKYGRASIIFLKKKA